jgi:hypothetical protein
LVTAFVSLPWQLGTTTQPSLLIEDEVALEYFVAKQTENPVNVSSTTEDALSVTISCEYSFYRTIFE